MGGFSSLPPLDTIEDFERLTSSGAPLPGTPSQALLDSLPEPPPPHPMTWVDNGNGEPVPPSWMKDPGPDWYRVVFDDGTEMSAAEYRAWRKANGVYAPPTAVTPDGKPVSGTSGGNVATADPSPRQASGAMPDGKAGTRVPASPSPATGNASTSPAPDTSLSPEEEERRRRLQTRTKAENARRGTIATSWRGVLSPSSTTASGRKTLLGE